MYIKIEDLERFNGLLPGESAKLVGGFTTEPTDTFVLDRLLDGFQDVFYRPTLETTRPSFSNAKRQILICDFSYKYMHRESRRIVLLVFYHMMKLGYKFFVWTGQGESQFIACETLGALIDVSYKIPIENLTYIKRAVSQLENTITLDHFGIRSLVSDCFKNVPIYEDVSVFNQSIFGFVPSRPFEPQIDIGEFDLGKTDVKLCIESLLKAAPGRIRLIIRNNNHLQWFLKNQPPFILLKKINELIVGELGFMQTINSDDLLGLIIVCSESVKVKLFSVSIEGSIKSEHQKPTLTEFFLFDTYVPQTLLSTVLMNVVSYLNIPGKDVGWISTNSLFYKYLKGFSRYRTLIRLTQSELFTIIDEQIKASMSIDSSYVNDSTKQLSLCDISLVNTCNPPKQLVFLQSYLSQLSLLSLHRVSISSSDLLILTREMIKLDHLVIAECPQLFCIDDWEHMEKFFKQHKLLSLKIVAAGMSNAITFENMAAILTMLPALESLCLINIPNFTSNDLHSRRVKLSHNRLHSLTMLNCGIIAEWFCFLSKELNNLSINGSSLDQCLTILDNKKFELILSGLLLWLESRGKELFFYGSVNSVNIIKKYYSQLNKSRSFHEIFFSGHGNYQNQTYRNTYDNATMPQIQLYTDPGALKEHIHTGTIEPDRVFEINEVFLGPESNNPVYIRQRVKVAFTDQYCDVIVPVDANSYSVIDDAMVLFKRLSSSDKRVRIGIIQQFELTNDWCVLPSDTSCDNLLHLQCVRDLEVGYNRSKSLYYVRSKTCLTSFLSVYIAFIFKPAMTKQQYDYYNCEPAGIDLKNIEFLDKVRFTENLRLVTDDSFRQLSQLSYRDKIMSVRQYLSLFGSKIITENPETQEIHEILNSLKGCASGLCEHRAVLGYYLLQGLGVHVRRVSNSVHSFCEIQLDGLWYSLDLGGVPGNILVHPLNVRFSSLNRAADAIKKVIDLPTDAFNWTLKLITNFILLFSIVRNVTASFIDCRPQSCVYATYLPPSHSSMTSLLPETIDANNSLRHMRLGDLPDWVSSISLLARYVTGKAAKSQLLIFEESRHLDNFVTTIRLQSLQKDLTVYSLASLSDLSLTSLVIEAGDYSIGDSHCLHFLKHAKEGDVFLVNWSDFRPENVGYYSMANITRKLKQFHIPDGVRLVSVTTEASLCHYGDAFTSRFPDKVCCPRTLSASEPFSITPTVEQEPNLIERINLNASIFWQGHVLGRVRFEATGVRYESGLLTLALAKQPREIVFVNPPDRADFHHFLHNLKLDRCFFANGRRIVVPISLSFSTREELPVWSSDQMTFEYASRYSSSACDEVMNAHTFDAFFTLRTVEGQNLKECPGILCKYPQLRVYLDHVLTEHQWFALQSELSKFPQNRLHFVGSESVFAHLPSFTNANNKAVKGEELPGSLNEKCVKLIETDDVEWGADQLCQKYNNHCIVLSVSASTEASVLIGQTQVSYQSGRIVFSYQLGALIQALKKNQPVIIAGEYSQSLLCQLASLFCNEPHLWVNGQRFVLTQSCIIVVGSNPYSHLLCVDQNKSPLSESSTITRAIERANGHMSEKDVRQKLALVRRAELPKTNCLLSNMDVNNSRLKQVRDILSHQPALLILGHTGCGKSWFVRHILSEQPDIRSFEGVAQVRDWATCRDSSARYIILHLDEIGLLPKSTFDHFLGLYSMNPHILLGSAYVELTPQHKLVGSGNPVSYGGRSMHSFWQGRVMGEVFAPLSPSFVDCNLLVKLDDSGARAVFSAVYRILFDHGLATPRNALNMMTQLALALENPVNAMDKNNTVRRCALNEVERITSDRGVLNGVLKTLAGVPALIHNGIDWDEQTLKMAEIGYILAHEHRPALLALHQHMRRRDFVLSPRNWLDHSNCSVILQGVSGIGKSSLVLAYLAVNGFKQCSVHTPTPSSKMLYYHFSSADFFEIEALLVQAFHAGIPVVIDEINTLPQVVERVLNTLLSGTDLCGESASNSGFMLIGTQNPAVQYAGRYEQSAAFINRCRIIDLPDYTESSLVNIAQKFNLSTGKAKYLVSHYLNIRDQALANHDLIVPTPRDFFQELRNLDLKQLRQQNPYYRSNQV